MARSLTLGSTRDSLLVVGDKTPDYPLGEQEGGGTSSRKSRDLNDNRLWQHDDNQASNKHCAAYDPVTLSKEEPAAFSDRLVISLPKPTVPSYSLNVGSGGGDDDDNNDDGGTKFCTNSFKNDPKPDSLTKRSRGGSGGEGRGD
ncbi:unnamed protein product, partial [Sphacelaria rigidula]